MANEHIVEVTTENWDAEVLQSSEPILVDFWATYCQPCLQLAPAVDQLAAEVSGKARVAKVDIQSSPELAVQNGVMAIPSLLIFKGGEVVERLSPRDHTLDGMQTKLLAHVG